MKKIIIGLLAASLFGLTGYTFYQLIAPKQEIKISTMDRKDISKRTSPADVAAKIKAKERFIADKYQNIETIQRADI